jgi:Domain of unknown function (DUF4276)
VTQKKAAIFVEGQTEQIFVERFLQEIGSAHSIQFLVQRAGPPLKTLRNDPPSTAPPGTPSFFVLLFDCGQDERVKSVILDRRKTLERASYDIVLGLRDLYPKSLADLAAVKQSLKTGVPTKGVPIHILLAVAEIEAWFIQEHTHFAKIDAHLDPATFKATFGFDPSLESAEAIPHPAELLHQIYSLAGKAYKKTRAHVERTVDVLDYAALYLDCVDRLPHLKEFISHVDNFLAAADADPQAAM